MTATCSSTLERTVSEFNSSQFLGHFSIYRVLDLAPAVGFEKCNEPILRTAYSSLCASPNPV